MIEASVQISTQRFSHSVSVKLCVMEASDLCMGYSNIGSECDPASPLLPSSLSTTRVQSLLTATVAPDPHTASHLLPPWSPQHVDALRWPQGIQLNALELSYVITCHHITCGVITFHLITFDNMPSHHITCDHIPSDYITCDHITSDHVTSHLITSDHITFDMITCYLITSDHMPSDHM